MQALPVWCRCATSESVVVTTWEISQLMKSSHRDDRTDGAFGRYWWVQVALLTGKTIWIISAICGAGILALDLYSRITGHGAL